MYKRLREDLCFGAPCLVSAYFIEAFYLTLARFSSAGFPFRGSPKRKLLPLALSILQRRRALCSSWRRCRTSCAACCSANVGSRFQAEDCSQSGGWNLPQP